ncbi:MAG TPA: hypothetical protein VNX25_02430, partial [Verrucomicrobiae bacterium]|nr:hypothetical protein [Verrucomicrobiae bacterium]
MKRIGSMGRRLVVLFQLAAVAAGAACFSAEAKSTPKVNIPVAPELYANEPKPLAVTDCASCHVGQFGDLRNNGTKHKFDCQKCHATFHVYNPKKGSWDDVMPKCATCHAEPHGKAVTDC